MTSRLAAFTLVAGIAIAQNRPSFEVASIKPNNSPDPRLLFDMQTSGRFRATNVTVRRLIEVAYDIKDFQLSGGSSWIGSDRFDINASAGEPTTDHVTTDRLKLMLQSLLADRFKLIVHTETKQMPTYTLVVDKNGPKFNEANASDPSTTASGQARRPGAVVIRRGLLTAQEVPVSALLNPLANILGRVVVDRTELKGKYDLKVEWRPDEMQVSMFGAMGVPEGFGAPSPDWQGPTLFTALEEQLGLKLNPQKGPVEILVIERIERLSEN